MKRKTLLLAMASAAFMGVLVLLGWGLARTGGRAGAFGINTQFGEVAVRRGSAPDFTVRLTDGGSLALADLRGRVVMVDFWATWCPPCRKEAPVLARVYPEYRDRGVEFVGVSIWDSPDAVRDFIRQFDITYPVAMPDRGSIAVEYGVSGIPEKFLIDADGVLVKRVVGPVEEAQLRRLLDGMLGEVMP